MSDQIKDYLQETTDDRRYEPPSIIRETRDHRDPVDRRNQQLSRLDDEGQSIIDSENLDR